MLGIRGALGLGFVLLLALLITRENPVVDRADQGRLTAARPKAGFVDMRWTPDTDPELERLVAEEKYVEAFAAAISRIEDRLDRLGPGDLLTLAAFRRAAAVAHLAEDQRLAACILDSILPALRRAGPSARLPLAEALIRLGYVSRYQGDRDRARSLYDEARRVLDGGPRSAPLEGFLAQANADWARRLDRKMAIDLYESALRLRRDAPDVPAFSIAENATWDAWVLSREGRWGEARDHAEEARAILKDIGIDDHALLATLDEVSAQDLVLRGRPKEALEAYARAARRSERSRQRHAPGVPRSQLASEAFNALAGEAIVLGRDEEAWDLRERGLGPVHAELAWLGRADERDPLDGHAMKAQARRLLAAMRDWDATPADAGAWTIERARLLVRVLHERTRLDEMRTAYLETHPVPPRTVADVRRALDGRTAMIGWLEVYLGDSPSPSKSPASSSGWAFVIRRDRPIRWVRLWSTRGAAAWFEWVRFGPGMGRISRAAFWPEHVIGDPEMTAGLQERDLRYFEPLRPYLDGIERLIVDGSFHMMPEAFVTPDGGYLTDQFETVHVPSAATFGILADAVPRSEAVSSILAVAAGPTGAFAPPSDFESKRMRNAFARAETAIADLPPLPFATVETADVARVFPRARRLEGITGNDAALDALASSGELGRFDVVHLAGHALYDPSPERGAIVVASRPPASPSPTRGLLSVEDVALSWQLRARLVTFSACESVFAGGGLRRGEPLGFSPASLGAGAPNVLSSFWPVDDRATSILMKRFYEDLTGRFAGERRGVRGRPMPAASALVEAKAYLRDMRDPTGARPYEHPSYWAGWMLIGTGN